jgi:hypothetical protein
MVVDTWHLVGLVVHEGRVDGGISSRQRTPSPGRFFANLVRRIPRDRLGEILAATR